jgi:ATP-dependent Clp endopeptidase proteolytic subunit ClpP
MSQQESSSDIDVDPVSREIYVVGGIDDSTTIRTISGIRVLDRKRGPIKIIISSCGGNEGSGWAIYDAIRTARNKIVGICYAECQSAATIILSACDERWMSPNCRFMIHNGTISYEGTMDQFLDTAKEVQLLSRKYCDILGRRAGLSPKTIQELAAKESYMSATEAVQFGFADFILEDKNDRKAKASRRKKS